MKTKCAILEYDNRPVWGSGWGNGYVCVNKRHSESLVPWDGLDVDIHGGITLNSMLKDMNASWKSKVVWLDNPPSDEKDWVVFGFDTAHFGDTLENWSREAVIKETKRLASMFRERKEKPVETLTSKVLKLLPFNSEA